MSFWSETWDKLQTEAEKSWDTFLETGAPALQASAERAAIDWLKKQNKETQAKLDEGVARLAEEPSGPLGDAFKDTALSTIFKNYGLYIVGGIGLIFIVGYAMRGK